MKETCSSKSYCCNLVIHYHLYDRKWFSWEKTRVEAFLAIWSWLKYYKIHHLNYATSRFARQWLFGKENRINSVMQIYLGNSYWEMKRCHSRAIWLPHVYIQNHLHKITFWLYLAWPICYPDMRIANFESTLTAKLHVDDTMHVRLELTDPLDVMDNRVLLVGAITTQTTVRLFGFPVVTPEDTP